MNYSNREAVEFVLQNPSCALEYFEAVRMVRADFLLGAENDLIKYWVFRSICWLIIQSLRG